MALDRARIDRPIRELALEHAAGHLEDEVYLERLRELREAKDDVLHAIYDQIVAIGRRIVSVRLTPSAYAHGLALALPTKVALARPTGLSVRMPYIFGYPSTVPEWRPSELPDRDHRTGGLPSERNR